MVKTTTDTETEMVATWADAHGRWHAKITLPGLGYGPSYLESRWDSIRRKARRAIRREIMARQSVGNGWRCRIEVVDGRLSHLNTALSFTFAERD